jgi:hypothetical protein
MVAITTQYAEFQDFFQRLGVKAPSVDMFIKELKLVADGERAPTVREVRHFIDEINRREPRDGTLKELNQLNILPVKQANGQVALRNTGNDFSIIDRLEYAKAFKGKTPILHFSLEEVHELQPFLSGLGLQGRYMSRIVEEKSTVEGGARDPDLSDKFRQKAYALFRYVLVLACEQGFDNGIIRCAVHYKSHKVRDGDWSLYNTLLAADVYQSDGFSKTLVLCQGGRRITVESGKANLHIKEDKKHLTLYVPREGIARERCYLSQLPERLLGYLAISDTAAKSTLTAILTGSQSVLNDILEDSGIVQVSGLLPLRSTIQQEDELEYHTVETDIKTSSSARPQRATPPGRSPGSPARTPFRPTTTPSPNPFARGSTTSANSSNSTFTFTYDPPVGTSSPAHPITPTPSPGPSSGPLVQETPTVFDSTKEYRALLDRVITAASQAKFPSRSLFDPNGLLHAGHSNPGMSRQRTGLSKSIFGNRSQNRMSHETKVGAAGELFVSWSAHPSVCW